MNTLQPIDMMEGHLIKVHLLREFNSSGCGPRVKVQGLEKNLSSHESSRVFERDKMGLISASGSFTRFLVDESLPEDYLGEFSKRIARYAFRGIDESSYDERAIGWVNILDMFDSAFLGMEFLKEPYIAMSWRVDVRKVPSKALKQYCREAEEKIKEADGLDYLPKARRREIKEIVHAKLLKRAIPRSQTYDMIWNLQTGVLIFGATSNKLCDEFAEFFLRCFDIHLKTLFPFFMASQIVQGQGLAPGLLDDLSSTISGRIK